MKRLSLIMMALLAPVTALSAQDRGAAFELRPFGGISVPTGSQRDLFKAAPLVGLQAAYEVRPSFHLVGSFGWISGNSKYPVGRDNVDVLTYDVGMELDLVRPLNDTWTFKPYLGAGLGARSYMFQDIALNDQTCFAGYGAVGTEFQKDVVALRLEARDNVFCYKSPVAGIKDRTQNDLSFAVGLAYHFRTH